MEPKKPKKKRGLGSPLVSPERRREIARLGGLAAKKRHRFTSDEAQAAGRKGGATVRDTFGKEYLQQIGRRGGIARQARRQENV